MMVVGRTWRNRSERGVSLLLIALGLTILLGFAGLAVDLAMLYVARSEAQRAADSAALAGAQQFTGPSVLEGVLTPAQAADLAAQYATQVGNQNLVVGQSPNLSKGNFPTASAGSSSCPPPAGVSGGCFNFVTSDDPRITVVVYKSMPTYFIKIFGITSVPVSAVATAEAYIPEGGGPDASVSCAKPWMMANCDPVHGGPAGSGPVNSLCPCSPGDPCYSSTSTNLMDYFVCPTDGSAGTTCTPGHVINPGLNPTGAVGEHLIVKTGDPTQTTVPSQFLPVYFPGPAGSTPVYTCPTCAANDQNASTTNSASLYRENIECCSSVTITCGSTPIQPIQGNMVGPTGQGVDCLIHEASNGSGQDCISLDSSNTCGTPVSLQLPFIVYAGSKNPYFATGSQVPTSDSLVNMPLYNGQVLCPGNSCVPTVDVQGFISVFITGETPKNNSVEGYVTGVTPCGGDSPEGGTGSITAAAGTTIPVRLIH
jgi:Flp pilus assembly protein TadG